MFLFFDAVGTLLKPVPDVVTAYHRIGMAHGSRLQPDEIRQRFAQLYPRFFCRSTNVESALQTSESRERSRWRSLVTELFSDVQSAAELFEELWQHFAQPSNWELYPDVAPMLRLLNEQRIPWGIASNFDQRLDAIIAGIPELAEAQTVVTSATAGWSKPSAEFFQFAASQAARPSSDVPSPLWMIGDNQSLDFEAAIACGWQALHLERDLNAAKEPWQIRSLVEVVERLGSG
jgi:putative hydrolase of the HAD superfamily